MRIWANPAARDPQYEISKFTPYDRINLKVIGSKRIKERKLIAASTVLPSKGIKFAIAGISMRCLNGKFVPA